MVNELLGGLGWGVGSSVTTCPSRNIWKRLSGLTQVVVLDCVAKCQHNSSLTLCTSNKVHGQP